MTEIIMKTEMLINFQLSISKSQSGKFDLSQVGLFKGLYSYSTPQKQGNFIVKTLKNVDFQGFISYKRKSISYMNICRWWVVFMPGVFIKKFRDFRSPES